MWSMDGSLTGLVMVCLFFTVKIFFASKNWLPDFLWKFSFLLFNFIYFFNSKNTPQNCPSSGQFSAPSISRDMHPKTNIIISLWLKQISQQTHRQISPSSFTIGLLLPHAPSVWEREADFRKPFSSNYLAGLNDQCF